MRNETGPIIDMNRDGDFLIPAKPGIGTILTRLAAFGVALLAIGAAFWLAVLMLPVMLVLMALGVAAASFQLKRSGFVVRRL